LRHLYAEAGISSRTLACGTPFDFSCSLALDRSQPVFRRGVGLRLRAHLFWTLALLRSPPPWRRSGISLRSGRKDAEAATLPSHDRMMTTMRYRTLAAVLLFLTAVAAAAAPMRVTVLDLQVEAGISNTEAAFVQDFVYGALVKITSLQVIDRGSRDKLLSEQAFALSDAACQSAECAVKVGALLSAQKVIIGRVGKLDSQVLVSLKTVDVETGIVTSAEVATADSLSLLQDALSPTVLALFGIKSIAPQAEGSSSRSAPRALVVQAQVKHLQLGGGTQTVYVTVVDDAGSPVAGAEITMTVNYRTSTRTVTLLPTDSGGRSSGSWSIGRPRGGYSVQIDIEVRKGQISGRGKTSFFAP
jgi:hypothetical protein